MHHCEALRSLTDLDVWKIATDYQNAGLSQKELICMEYAEKLTITPAECDESDVTKIRRHGFTDQDILQINLTVGYFNFVNRVALGLGVELESNWSNKRLQKLSESQKSWEK